MKAMKAVESRKTGLAFIAFALLQAFSDVDGRGEAYF